VQKYPFVLSHLVLFGRNYVTRAVEILKYKKSEKCGRKSSVSSAAHISMKLVSL
jgi:hypothetical protein